MQMVFEFYNVKWIDKKLQPSAAFFKTGHLRVTTKVKAVLAKWDHALGELFLVITHF